MWLVGLVGAVHASVMTVKVVGANFHQKPTFIIALNAGVAAVVQTMIPM